MRWMGRLAATFQEIYVDVLVVGGFDPRTCSMCWMRWWLGGGGRELFLAVGGVNRLLAADKDGKGGGVQGYACVLNVLVVG